MNYAVFVGSSVINLEVDKEKHAIVLPRNFLLDRIVILFLLHVNCVSSFALSRWISKSNSSMNESNLSMKRGMRRKKVLRSCNSKSVRRSSSLTPILEMQRNTGAGRMKLQNS
ncbi:hypothetical protein V6Z12_D08G192400 [Gossypium hirsutum]